MKNRKFLYGMIVFVLIAAIGVGYAATTQILTIGGTAKAAAVVDDQLNGKVIFTKAEKGTNCADAAIDNTDKTKATMTTAALTDGQTATAKFTVTNNSDWKIKLGNLSVTGYDAEYFTVTCDAANQEIAAGGNTVVTVTVTLKKVPVEAITADDFTITFNGVTIAS